MKSLRLLALAPLALAACERQPAPNAENATPEPPPVANVAEATPPPVAPGTTLPPADANLRFIGWWAPDAKACGETPWLFNERGLETAGGMTCSFDRINQVPGGYDIAATCTAQMEETPDRVRLRFAESARAMMLETDASLEPTGLVYCGPGGMKVSMPQAE